MEPHGCPFSFKFQFIELLRIAEPYLGPHFEEGAVSEADWGSCWCSTIYSPRPVRGTPPS